MAKKIDESVLDELLKGCERPEDLLAAVAAHDREKNAEQSSSRSHARLLNGFWIFHPPVGYMFEKAPGGGRRIVPFEPLASIITEALEGFAIGRFQNQTEVKRFLESKPEFPGRDRWGEVKVDRVKTILTCILYAAWLEYPKWGIPLVKAQHQPLISYETYLRIQARLNTKSVAPHRKDFDGEFPLRGFLLCGRCDYRLTACWSTSHTGKKYP